MSFPAAHGKINIMNIIYSKYYYGFVLIYIILTSIVGVFSINFFGAIRSFTNTSNSMNPVINTGSIVTVRKLDTYKIGDVISYYVQSSGKEEIVTHRILREGGNVFVTKGDANQVVDRELVQPKLVIGKVILIIPYLGYYISFAKGGIGVWVVILVPAMLVVMAELYKIIKETEGNLSENGQTDGKKDL